MKKAGDETDMVDADSRLIEWLFHESEISRYKISKDTGISESTLSRIASGYTQMEAVKFGLAHKLTEYARSVQSKALRAEKDKEEGNEKASKSVLANDGQADGKQIEKGEGTV